MERCHNSLPSNDFCFVCAQWSRVNDLNLFLRILKILKFPKIIFSNDWDVFLVLFGVCLGVPKDE